MSNIYEVLLQTISISAICIIILILKWILADKLSPKWQYGVWSVLIISILIPYKLNTYTIPSLVIYFEMFKTAIEKTMNSAYIGIYEPLNAEHVLPIINQSPVSITDWLFFIYIIGILIYLLWHLIAYIRLRMILKHGNLASSDYLSSVIAKYNLKGCKVVEAEGIESAFICGVINPILAIPKGQEIDEKILLHELIHLKYKDPLQNVLWCILKSLHWFNPFMHYVFNRIGNDMESLCDQRVLEKLEGEERREYGNILLNMANNKYSRMAGTSSISNGGKNISRRIQSIVRFKLFPKGMAIVSVCTIIVLASTFLVGTTVTYSQSEYTPPSNGIEKAMALTRVNRCTTLAGALDTYGKGILTKNILYIATASPLDKQAELEQQMANNHKNGNFINHYQVDEVFYDLDESLYFINMYKVDDEKYTAYLTFLTGYYDLANEEFEQARDSILLPVEVSKEESWVVREIGDPIVLKGVDAMWNYAEFNYEGGAKVYRGEGKTGSVEVVINTFYDVNNNYDSGAIWYGMYQMFDRNIKVDAEIWSQYDSVRITYDSNNKTIKESPTNRVKIFYKALDSIEEKYEFPDSNKNYENVSGSDGFYSQTGPGWTYQTINDSWDGKVIAGDGGGISGNTDIDVIDVPKAYVIRVLWDGNVMEDILVKEVQP